MRTRLLGVPLAIGLLLAIMVPPLAAASLVPGDVKVVGLFKGSAVIVVQGKQRLLKEGQRSAEGVLLVKASAHAATLEVAGEEYEVALSRALGSYQKPSQTSTIIAINPAGQYLAQGSINGQPIEFLVDTGATAIAMNTRAARRLGIDFAAGKPGMVSTAGGMVKSYGVMLDTVKVGDIEVKHVRAAVLEGVYPTHVLLGMTFLGKVKIVESAGMMELTKKY